MLDDKAISTKATADPLESSEAEVRVPELYTHVGCGLP